MRHWHVELLWSFKSYYKLVFLQFLVFNKFSKQVKFLPTILKRLVLLRNQLTNEQFFIYKFLQKLFCENLFFYEATTEQWSFSRKEAKIANVGVLNFLNEIWNQVITYFGQQDVDIRNSCSLSQKLSLFSGYFIEK